MNRFVTIKIFARIEHNKRLRNAIASFVTIKIFARTEQSFISGLQTLSFVTIKIFARTELNDNTLRLSSQFCYHKDFCWDGFKK